MRAIGMVKPPGGATGRRVGTAEEGLVHISDWLPTLLSAAGHTNASSLSPGLRGLDGVDQVRRFRV